MQQTARKLLSTEREDLIIRYVSEGLKTVGELVEKLGVSEATVRRDLENLEITGQLQRVLLPRLPVLLQPDRMKN